MIVDDAHQAEGLSGFVSKLLLFLDTSLEGLAAELRVPLEDLGRVAAGEAPADDMRGRLIRFAQRHQMYKLMERHGIPVPAFNHFRDFWENFNSGPADPSADIPRALDDLPQREVSILGHKL